MLAYQLKNEPAELNCYERLGLCYMKTGDIRRMQMYHRRCFEMIFEPEDGISRQNMNRMLSLKENTKRRNEIMARNGGGAPRSRYTGSE